MSTINDTYTSMLVLLTAKSIIIGACEVSIAAVAVRRPHMWFRIVFTVLVAGFVLATVAAVSVVARALTRIPERCSGTPFCLVGDSSDLVATAVPLVTGAMVFIVAVIYITIAERTICVAPTAWVEPYARARTDPGLNTYEEDAREWSAVAEIKG